MSDRRIRPSSPNSRTESNSADRKSRCGRALLLGRKKTCRTEPIRPSCSYRCYLHSFKPLYERAFANEPGSVAGKHDCGGPGYSGGYTLVRVGVCKYVRVSSGMREYSERDKTRSSNHDKANES